MSGPEPLESSGGTVAPFGHDAVALEIARRLETLEFWADRWPALAFTA